MMELDLKYIPLCSLGSSSQYLLLLIITNKQIIVPYLILKKSNFMEEWRKYLHETLEKKQRDCLLLS